MVFLVRAGGPSKGVSQALPRPGGSGFARAFLCGAGRSRFSESGGCSPKLHAVFTLSHYFSSGKDKSPYVAHSVDIRVRYLHSC